MSIELIPPLSKYPQIIDSYKNGKLVIFVGAGTSSLWGCWRWKELASKLIERCYTDGCFNYWVRDSLLKKHSLSPRRLITIAKNNLSEDAYKEVLVASIDPISRFKQDAFDLFNLLYSLESIFVTTNYDTHLSCLFDKRFVHSDLNEFSTANLLPKHLFHLHGVIDDTTSLVLTIEEYLQRYREPRFSKFLLDFFSDPELTFLFVGYGVDEMEILDYMVEKFSDDSKLIIRTRDPFFALMPFFQNETELLKHEQSYFNKIQMTVIPYALDKKGYGQLFYVIKDLVESLRGEKMDDPFYENAKLIDENL